MTPSHRHRRLDMRLSLVPVQHEILEFVPVDRPRIAHDLQPRKHARLAPQLQARLVKAINATLEQKEGFGGVGNVYFTSFVVQ